MDSAQKTPATIDDYIAAFPEDVQQRLQVIRQTIHQAAPQATEAISYGMPTFKPRGTSSTSPPSSITSASIPLRRG